MNVGSIYKEPHSNNPEVKWLRCVQQVSTWYRKINHTLSPSHLISVSLNKHVTVIFISLNFHHVKPLIQKYLLLSAELSLFHLLPRNWNKRREQDDITLKKASEVFKNNEIYCKRFQTERRCSNPRQRQRSSSYLGGLGMSWLVSWPFLHTQPPNPHPPPW